MLITPSEFGKRDYQLINGKPYPMDICYCGFVFFLTDFAALSLSVGAYKCINCSSDDMPADKICASLAEAIFS